jgi:prolipoprotein diacylglyceryl transferase
VIAAIPSPSTSGFAAGPFEIHLYGLTYAAAIAAGIWITVRRWEARGGSRELVYDVALWAFPAGLIGARIYFDLTSMSEVPDHWWGPFALWEGGLGSYGGFAAGIAVAIWRIHRAGVPISKALDAGAPGLLVAHGIGRFGNYFNQELFGGPTSLPWGIEIDPANRPEGYAQDSVFQPTFLYEAIWDFSLAGFLVWLDNSREIRPPGLFALYITGYAAFRSFNETLRVDPSHYILGMRLNFFVACLVAIGGAIWFAWTQGWWGRRRTEPQVASP